MTLLEKCNADVFKAILDLKEESPEIGEKLIAILQEYKYWWQIPVGDMLWFSAHLPREIWDCKVYTFQFLFEFKQTTTMP